ncbi:pantetheine-phosphate adenylyltransferase [Candidatus Frankia alpina]|uniref:Phosphopantetheine adenylyltransferase n=1 Tax=Candidatus Frankia alpina TaxID=2699483 RepID=A0A4S5EUV0_9ACTN|nr:pantetheine-phosphate adenylyltransferase [Candidatus Frankia alpina]THJ76375.1 pantetheine-phosphate adenylyltransferase [Candidatus Frankia alpina]
MRRAVCPGSFDPITNGHLDIVVRASKLFDEVVVAVSINKNKATLFTIDERMELIREAVRNHPMSPSNVVVDASHGLVVDFCRARGIQSIVKGLRAVSDFDYELQMAQMNNSLAGVETLFMSTNPQYAFLSSSLVKEVARYGGDVSHLVPDVVLKQLRERAVERAVE